MKKVISVKEIEPKESQCILVDSDRKLFKTGNVVSHNSVLQRSIIFSCVLRPESWYFIGVDLKRVELTPYIVYKNVVLGVAQTLEHALEVLRFAQQTMMSRYEMMTQLGIKNFLDLPEKGRALMVMIDEFGEAASPTGSKTEEGKEADAMKGEIQMLVGSIARLGRAAGVHLIIATQRPDAKMLSGETKDLKIDTKILTTQGWKTMGEINIGDKVFDEQGKTTEVINMTETMHGNEVYKINFKQGVEPIIAGSTHKWPIYTPLARNDHREVLDHHVRYPKHKELLENILKFDIKNNPSVTMREFEEIVNNGERIHIFRRLVNEKKIKLDHVVKGKNGQFDKSFYDSASVVEQMTLRLTRKFGNEKKNDSKIMTTEEIFNAYKNIGDQKYALDVTQPLKFKEKKLLVDPWLVGFWLGDGSSYGGSFATVDKEIPQKIEELGYKVNKHKAKHLYGITGLTSQLRKLNLIKNKHIPNDYLFSSIEQRKQLLAGLLDSDGTAARKQVSFVNTNKKLADGVLFLARSLGYKASISKYIGKEDTNPNSVCYGITGQDYYRVVFTATEPVFTLKRKNDMLALDSKDRETQKYHYIESVEEVDTVPTKCIQVDNESSTYLAGESLIPTHNSNLGVRINCGYAPPLTSSMILDNNEGTKVKAKPKGRFYIKIYNEGDHGQAFFAQETWLDEYLDARGLNQDGTPKGSGEENTVTSVDGQELHLEEAKGNDYHRPEDDWDDDLDDLINENNA